MLMTLVLTTALLTLKTDRTIPFSLAQATDTFSLSIPRASHSLPVIFQNDNTAIERMRSLVGDIVASSFPELRKARIDIQSLESKSDYFEARFGISHFFVGRMRYRIYVNPKVFEHRAPESGIRAIVAHELAHVLYFHNRRRIQLVGLVRLASKGFTARFERWADLIAISRGYGEGLKEYRHWLYQNVPSSKLLEKHRNYFSPEEIDAILSATQRRPELITYWLQHVPLSLDEIRAKQ